MLIKKINIVSYAGNKYNEDRAFMVHKDKSSNVRYAAWVIDGETGLSKDKKTKLNGAWFADKWDQYLTNHILNFKLTIQEILLEGMMDIEEDYLNELGNHELSDVEKPTIQIALIRWHEQVLEYYILGNCQLWIRDYKSIKVIADPKLSKFNNKIIEKVKSLINKGYTLEQANELAYDMIFERNSKCNKKNGYWLLSFNRIAIYHGVSGSLKYNNDYDFLELLLSTDGFHSVCDKYKIMNEMNVFSYIRKKSLEELCKSIRKTENRDSQCKTYARMQKSDDASAAYIMMERELCDRIMSKTI